jgi:hypothetical protein
MLLTANVVPSSLIFSTLMVEATRSSEMLVLTSATRRHIPEKIKSYGMSLVQLSVMGFGQPDDLLCFSPHLVPGSVALALEFTGCVISTIRNIPAE